jgi:hypothetical protein
MRYLYNDDDIEEYIGILLDTNKVPASHTILYILEGLVYYQMNEDANTIKMFENKIKHYKTKLEGK